MTKTILRDRIAKLEAENERLISKIEKIKCCGNCANLKCDGSGRCLVDDEYCLDNGLRYWAEHDE